MEAVLFTKLFGGRGVDEIATAAIDLGFDGIDLLIRPGATVPTDRPDGIAAAVKQFAARGLAVPMATTDLTDPDDYPAEQVLGGCAEAGIGLVRLGYWTYDGSRPYQELLANARRQLDRLDSLAERFELRLAVQLHGGTIHSSGALAYALLADRDPTRFGAYPDPGNQAVQDGREDWRLTLDLLSPWLCCIGVKNGAWMASGTTEHGQRAWRSDWVGLADGMVPWADILSHLARSGYDSLLSFHSHYELPYEQVLDQTRTDLRFVRRVLEAR